MKKRMLAFFLALGLCLGLEGQAFAAQAPQGEMAVGHGSGHAERDDIAPNYVSGRLSTADRAIYNLLKEKFTQVANGQLDSSIFTFDVSGLEIYHISSEKMSADVNAAVNALLMDCPYEQYWFQKVKGWNFVWNYNTGTKRVNTLTVKCHTTEDYAQSVPGENSYYIYKPDTSKTKAAAAAVRSAQAVVQQNSGRSDYEKLAAYKDYICGQVEYDDNAVKQKDYYGAPWQLVNAFDNDPKTNIVCEGYAKAFKYLCDLSTFDNDINCYLVTGYTDESHMWNTVRVNGQSYLVDVTACDSERGQFGDWFLAGASNATTSGFSLRLPRRELSDGRYYAAKTDTYTYKDESKQLYGSEILVLSSTSLDPAALAAPTPTPTPTPAPTPTPTPASTPFTDVPAGQYYTEAVSWAVSGRITTGTSTTTFSPGQNCTHAQIITFLWRAMGEPRSSSYVPPAWTGVQPGHYAYDALGWASWEGMLTNLSANGGPDGYCTRAQAMDYIWTAFGSPRGGTAGFSDIPSSMYYASAVAWAVDSRITNGTGGGRFSPDTVCDRGTIVTFLHRAFVEEARLK